ncbi:MAG: tryptophan 2,3-dioxygenase family protein [Bacteroidia bacterium]|nr:tryptophan 2,3-dioxygenase family protein [Bacteroidia bacterium]
MKTKEGKYTTIHYQEYLQLGKLLNAQDLRSAKLEEPAHEEMLFIIVHQVYELWFKQIIHELNSVLELFAGQEVKDRDLSIAIGRMRRVESILKLLVEQIAIMESMTPLDFLDFRNYLFPASGFQSFQFRAVECLLGLPEKQRMTYHGHRYSSVFPEEQQAQLDSIYEGGTLLEKVNDWLGRVPFLNLNGFDFLSIYKQSVNQMLEKESQAILSSEYLTDKEKEMRKKMTGSMDTYFQAILERETHEKLLKEGKKRLSYEATIGALFINLYRDEPILQLPFQFISCLIDIDNQMTSWRFRHAQMVLRMIGNKIGTGGSSGHEYLAKTAQEHQIFSDFHNISTLLIPRSELPALPKEILAQLNFHFNTK